MVEDIQQAGRLEEEDGLLLWCISGWTYAGSFAEFVFSVFLLLLKEGYVSVFQYVGIEQKKNGVLKS